MSLGVFHNGSRSSARCPAHVVPSSELLPLPERLHARPRLLSLALLPTGVAVDRDRSALATDDRFSLPADRAFKVESLGGEVVAPRTEIPQAGWFGVFKDPTGNRVALYTSMPHQG